MKTYIAYRGTLIVFALLFLLGWETAAFMQHQRKNNRAEQTMQMEQAADNWGLGFGESGKELQPTGNVPAQELAKEDAYYIGSDTEKVIYLTFDCGYETEIRKKFWMR